MVATAATACAPTLPPCVSFAVKFPKRESQSEDSACPGPAQRPPPDRANRPSYQAQTACDGMSHISRSLLNPDRLRPRDIEHRRRQRPAAPVPRFSRLPQAPSFRVFPTASRRVRVPRFQIDQTIDDGGRSRSAIEVAADRYQRRLPAVGVLSAMQQEAAQLIQTTMKIADDVSERHCSFRPPFAFQ